MNGIENIEVEILEIISKKQDYDDKFNKIMFSFVVEANKLVILSDGLYQIEHSIKLNKISLKDYILNSEICNILKDNNIRNYSTQDLKAYMNRYEEQNISNIGPYKMALVLYEKLEELETLENDKIDYEVKRLSSILNDVSNIESVNKEHYKELYNNLVLQIKEKYLNTNIIDDKINNYIIQILKDIFNYYMYGNKEIFSAI